jgi:hypothetical protein
MPKITTTTIQTVYCFLLLYTIRIKIHDCYTTLVILLRILVREVTPWIGTRPAAARKVVRCTRGEASSVSSWDVACGATSASSATSASPPPPGGGVATLPASPFCWGKSGCGAVIPGESGTAALDPVLAMLRHVWRWSPRASSSRAVGEG